MVCGNKRIPWPTAVKHTYKFTAQEQSDSEHGNHITSCAADVLAQILNGNDDADTDRAGPKLLFLRHNSPQPQSLASSMSTAVSPHITPNPLGIANDSGAPSDGVLGLSINHAEPHLDASTRAQALVAFWLVSPSSFCLMIAATFFV